MFGFTEKTVAENQPLFLTEGGVFENVQLKEVGFGPLSDKSANDTINFKFDVGGIEATIPVFEPKEGSEKALEYTNKKIKHILNRFVEIEKMKQVKTWEEFGKEVVKLFQKADVSIPVRLKLTYGTTDFSSKYLNFGYIPFIERMDVEKQQVKLGAKELAERPETDNNPQDQELAEVSADNDFA